MNLPKSIFFLPKTALNSDGLSVSCNYAEPLYTLSMYQIYFLINFLLLFSEKSFTRITKPILPTPLTPALFIEDTTEANRKIDEVKVKGHYDHKVHALQGPETFLLGKRPKKAQKPLSLSTYPSMKTIPLATKTTQGTCIMN